MAAMVYRTEPVLVCSPGMEPVMVRVLAVTTVTKPVPKGLLVDADLQNQASVITLLETNVSLFSNQSPGVRRGFGISLH